jgi:hypothetical protein
MGGPRFADEWTGLVAVSCNVFIEAPATPAAKLRGSSSFAQADLRKGICALASTRLFPSAHCGFIYNEAAIFREETRMDRPRIENLATATAP